MPTNFSGTIQVIHSHWWEIHRRRVQILFGRGSLTYGSRHVARGKLKISRYLLFNLTILAATSLLQVSCGEEFSFQQDSRATLSTFADSSDEDRPLSLHEKIAHYPTADRFGLIEDRYRWMERIELVEGLRLAEARVKDTPIIAILDSGVDYDHPALQDNLYRKPEDIASHCGNDLHGCDTSNYVTGSTTLGNGEIYPAGTQGPGQYCKQHNQGVQVLECSHGTHVAGVIAGFSDEYAIYGICPQCRVLSIKVVGADGTIADQAIIGALQYINGLKRAGVPIRVVNSSFGKFLSSERVAAALDSLAEFKNDILMVAAAGNENTSIRTYPASFAHVIAVANVNSSNLQKDAKSNFGRWVDIAAPVGNCTPGFPALNGFGVVSAVPGGGSRCANGTSVAAPMVAAVAGLLLSVEPDLSVADLRERILAGADATALYDANPDFLQMIGEDRRPLLGSGLLNVKNALNGTAKGLEGNNKGTKRVSLLHCGTVAQAGRYPATDGACLALLALLPLIIIIRPKDSHKTRRT